VFRGKRIAGLKRPGRDQLPQFIRDLLMSRPCR
jgi:hypothetical protein